MKIKTKETELKSVKRFEQTKWERIDIQKEIKLDKAEIENKLEIFKENTETEIYQVRYLNTSANVEIIIQIGKEEDFNAIVMINKKTYYEDNWKVLVEQKEYSHNEMVEMIYNLDQFNIQDISVRTYKSKIKEYENVELVVEDKIIDIEFKDFIIKEFKDRIKMVKEDKWIQYGRYIFFENGKNNYKITFCKRKFYATDNSVMAQAYIYRNGNHYLTFGFNGDLKPEDAAELLLKTFDVKKVKKVEKIY